jgi:hypothetical protein
MPIPQHPWRFSPGDQAYARPCTTAYEVTLIKPLIHTSPQGIKCPHWLARDAAGAEHMISQLELSSRPATLKKDGSVKILRLLTK